MSSATAPAYSARDIIDRYESEEDEFIRELEEMRRNLPKTEEEDIPQDPAPILSVLCSLVDEIGSLRSENRHLKTRLAPSPSRTKNMVQRMSAIFDTSGRSSIIPKLRRPAHAEIRTGARERLSTPPRKDCLTTSSISTDFSTRAPPLVEPEMSDSDIDENVFSEQDYTRCSRRGASRRCEMSLSECTSPSSASSSREPSEAMTTSRSSFFEILGFRRRRGPEACPLPPAKPILKKKKRRLSQEISTLHYTSNENFQKSRRPLATKPPRPASYYPREDSEDSDHIRARKASSFLDVHANRIPVSPRVDWETRHRHEKDALMAQIEEMKMRNQRLVEQLRDKSSQFSKLQVHSNRLEEKLDHYMKQEQFNEKIDKMVLDERIIKVPGAIMDKVEEQLRQFDQVLRSFRSEMNTNCQKALNTNAQERVVYQTCLEHLDKLQRENFTLMKNESSLEPTIRRKLELLPSYEALYSLTTRAVQKISELRWNLMEKTAELGKAEISLIQAKANHLLSNTQVENLRLKVKNEWKKPKRPSSFHGEAAVTKMRTPELSLLHLSQYRVNTVDRMRKLSKMRSIEGQIQVIEKEFLNIIGKEDREPLHTRGFRPESRIEHMMREMGRQKVKATYSPVLEKKESDKRNRPISMAEIEEEMRQRIYEERKNKEKKEPTDLARRLSLRAIVSSTQDIREIRSPSTTPIVARRILVQERMCSRFTAEGISRPRKIERGFSTDSGQVDINVEEAKLRQEHQRAIHMEEKRKSMSLAGSGRLQRSMPVQVSRIRPPTTNLRTNIPRPEHSQRLPEEPKDSKNVMKPARSWLEKIRSMKKN